jgi:rhodanese-related sulfurtransferase
MRKMFISWLFLASVLLALGTNAPVQADTASPLSGVEAELRRTFPKVPLVAPADLDKLEKSGTGVVILDVRSEQEFAVSHIAGAQRVDPGLSAAQFKATLGGQIAGKTIVVYCSVGQRSSTLADRIGDVAKQYGADGVYNLQGGIFRWHNESRPLIGPAGATDEVHPYSASAARLIERKDGIAYAPGSSKAAAAK